MKKPELSRNNCRELNAPLVKMAMRVVMMIMMTIGMMTMMMMMMLMI